MKISAKMKLRIITKNHAADPEIGYITKSISKPYCSAAAMAPAWELMIKLFFIFDTYLYYQKSCTNRRQTKNSAASKAKKNFNRSGFHKNSINYLFRDFWLFLIRSEYYFLNYCVIFVNNDFISRSPFLKTQVIRSFFSKFSSDNLSFLKVSDNFRTSSSM